MKGLGASRMGLMAALAGIVGQAIPAGIKISNALSRVFQPRVRGVTFYRRRDTNKFDCHTPQGERECARRRRQMARNPGL
jgi:hypothetical protein